MTDNRKLPEWLSSGGSLRLRRMAQSGFARGRLWVLTIGGIGSLLLAACVSDDSAAGQGPSCEQYCNAMATHCAGTSAQYRDAQECAKACALLPLGTNNDGDLNTIGCRIHKAEAGQCVAAGPFGGDVCGKRCTSFCTIVVQNCKDQPNPVYNSEATCNEACSSFVDPAGEPTSFDPLSHKNSLTCRSQHAILSLGDPVTHCPHPGVISPVCKD